MRWTVLIFGPGQAAPRQAEAAGAPRMRIGVGMPPILCVSRPQTSGLPLVTDLTRQLQWTRDVSPPGSGATFSISFATRGNANLPAAPNIKP